MIVILECLLLSKFKITNEYDKPVVSVKVTKVWDDRDNDDGSRPTAIAVKLLANGKDTGKSIALNEANEWTYTFEELDKHDEKGVAIKYEVEETEVPKGYTVNITGDMEKGYVITNTFEVKTGDTDDMRIWGSVMAVSMLCMIFLALKKRKG